MRIFRVFILFLMVLVAPPNASALDGEGLNRLIIELERLVADGKPKGCVQQVGDLLEALKSDGSLDFDSAVTLVKNQYFPKTPERGQLSDLRPKYTGLMTKVSHRYLSMRTGEEFFVKDRFECVDDPGNAIFYTNDGGSKKLLKTDSIIQFGFDLGSRGFRNFFGESDFISQKIDTQYRYLAAIGKKEKKLCLKSQYENDTSHFFGVCTGTMEDDSGKRFNLGCIVADPTRESSEPLIMKGLCNNQEKRVGGYRISQEFREFTSRAYANRHCEKHNADNRTGWKGVIPGFENVIAEFEISTSGTSLPGFFELVDSPASNIMRNLCALPSYQF